MLAGSNGHVQKSASEPSDGSSAPLGVERSQALWEQLKAAGHFDAKGKLHRTDAVGQLQPRPGAAGGAGWIRAALLRGRDEERAVHRRSAGQGAEQDRVREGALRGASGEGYACALHHSAGGG